MRKSRFTDSQTMDALRRVEAGIGVPDLCRSFSNMGRCRALLFGLLGASSVSEKWLGLSEQVFPD